MITDHYLAVLSLHPNGIDSPANSSIPSLTMWRLSIPLLLLLVPSHNNNSFGLKSADGTNKHQQRRQEENNRGRSQQQRGNNNYDQQYPWSNFGGDPFGGAGAGKHQELYHALNVTPDATDKEIKSSYRKLALEVRSLYLFASDVSKMLTCL
jgi:hypothetical protein